VESSSQKIIPVILAGGTGKRLWPMSRTVRPKQFIEILSGQSLFQQTLLRLKESELYADPVIVANNDYRFLVAEQAAECSVELHAIILEPCPKNTAAAIVAASAYLNTEPDGRAVHILPSDHYIVPDERYFNAVQHAQTDAGEGRLVTFGIMPTEPATGYGYIEAADENAPVRAVTNFHEKPDLETAQKFVAQENYLWNSGMFLFNTKIFLEECETLAPEVCSAAKEAVAKSRTDLDFVRLDEDAFEKSPSISVDYAIFEKTTLASVVPSSFEWSDLGSWDAVWRMGEKDNHQNVAIGQTTIENTSNSLVLSDKMHVAVDGVDDLAVIVSEDAAYIGRLSNAQNVGAIVELLQTNSDTKLLTEAHLTDYRPWGGFTSILKGETFQVKRLFVNPGKRLSLQKHHHRSEHWIIVCGTAEVEIDGIKKTLVENESAYIQQGAIHRLTNPGKIILELIEVQTGSYLGEDDIIRIEDEFGRE